jgi:hypothetical protein
MTSDAYARLNLIQRRHEGWRGSRFQPPSLSLEARVLDCYAAVALWTAIETL